MSIWKYSRNQEEKIEPSEEQIELSKEQRAKISIEKEIRAIGAKEYTIRGKNSYIYIYIYIGKYTIEDQNSHIYVFTLSRGGRLGCIANTLSEAEIIGVLEIIIGGIFNAIGSIEPI